MDQETAHEVLTTASKAVSEGKPVGYWGQEPDRFAIYLILYFLAISGDHECSTLSNRASMVY